MLKCPDRLPLDLATTKFPPRPRSDATFREAVSEEIRKIARWYRRSAAVTDSPGQIAAAEGLERQAFRYRHCQEEYITLSCLDCERAFVTPSRCESRVCQECARKYAYKVRLNYQDRLGRLPRLRGKWPMFLTVTKRVSPGESLAAWRVQEVFKHFHTFVGEFYPKSAGCGALAVLEVGTHGHIHIHALVYGYKVAQARLSSRWREISGDSRVVDIRQVRNVRGCIGYILKYVLKPVAVEDPKHLAEYLVALRGVRRIRTYGVFYGQALVALVTMGCLFCRGTLRFKSLGSCLGIPEDAVTFAETRALLQGA